MRLLLSAAVVFTALVAALGDDVCDLYGNGCSVPFGLPLFYKSKFKHPCNCHDICYGCGASLDVSKSKCDERFLSDMKATCSAFICRGAAKHIYFKAVHKFGDKHYNEASSPDSYCSISAVRSHVRSVG